MCISSTWIATKPLRWTRPTEPSCCCGRATIASMSTGTPTPPRWWWGGGGAVVGVGRGGGGVVWGCPVVGGCVGGGGGVGLGGGGGWGRGGGVCGGAGWRLPLVLRGVYWLWAQVYYRFGGALAV